MKVKSKLAKALEGQHGFTVGSVLKFVGMDYEEYDEVTHIFKDESGEIQYLIESEFEWLEATA